LFAPTHLSFGDSLKAIFGKNLSLLPTLSLAIIVLLAHVGVTSFEILAFCLLRLCCQLLRQYSTSASPNFVPITSLPLLLRAALSKLLTLPVV